MNVEAWNQLRQTQVLHAVRKCITWETLKNVAKVRDLVEEN